MTEQAPAVTSGKDDGQHVQQPMASAGHLNAQYTALLVPETKQPSPQTHVPGAAPASLSPAQPLSASVAKVQSTLPAQVLPNSQATATTLHSLPSLASLPSPPRFYPAVATPLSTAEATLPLSTLLPIPQPSQHEGSRAFTATAGGSSLQPALPVNASRRDARLQRYQLWALERRISELSALVEAAIIEARPLVNWRQYVPQQLGQVQVTLTQEDRQVIEEAHRARMADVANKTCLSLLKAIQQHKWAFPFNAPVDIEKYPDYPSFVETPMDLSTMKANCEAGTYKDPHEFWDDLMLVFNNARKYNPIGSDCYLMADTLQEYAQERYEKLLAPKLAEEAGALARDEAQQRRYRAQEILNQQELALARHARRMDELANELLAAVAEAKAVAMSMCTVPTAAEEEQLTLDVAKLPTDQTAAMVTFLKIRKQLGEMGVDGASFGTAPKVVIDFGKCDSLTERQLQHFVACCKKKNGAVVSNGSPKVKETAEASAAPSATSGMTRNIPDVLSSAINSISEKAGISWPGIPLGTGRQAVPRAALPQAGDVPSAPAAGGLQLGLFSATQRSRPPRVPGSHKRKAPSLSKLHVPEADEGGTIGPLADAAAYTTTSQVQALEEGSTAGSDMPAAKRARPDMPQLPASAASAPASTPLPDISAVPLRIPAPVPSTSPPLPVASPQSALAAAALALAASGIHLPGMSSPPPILQQGLQLPPLPPFPPGLHLQIPLSLPNGAPHLPLIPGQLLDLSAPGLQLPVPLMFATDPRRLAPAHLLQQLTAPQPPVSTGLAAVPASATDAQPAAPDAATPPPLPAAQAAVGTAASVATVLPDEPATSHLPSAHAASALGGTAPHISTSATAARGIASTSDAAPLVGNVLPPLISGSSNLPAPASSGLPAPVSAPPTNLPQVESKEASKLQVVEEQTSPDIGNGDVPTAQVLSSTALDAVNCIADIKSEGG